MGECDANDFKIELQEDGENRVWDAVKVLKTGDVTPPLVTSEGLTIFKCIERIDKSENTGLPALRLSRIVLHRALLYPEHDRAELRTAIERERRQAAFGAFSKQLREGIDIKFPNGIGFLPKRLRYAYRKFLPVVEQPAKTNVAEKVKK